MTNPSRRTFLGSSFAGLAAAPSVTAAGANRKIVVGVMGAGVRGTSLACLFASRPNAEVAYVCDVDSERAGKAAEKAAAYAKLKTPPKVIGDFRRILDDKAVDVFVCAACNHWHAPATILACAAGKHVYVEKPCSHNPREGELMVAAARKYDRRVQMGNQRRSTPVMIEAVEALRGGAIGRAYFAQSWYTNQRQSIGIGEAVDPPKTLDYELWQGPAPRKAFRSNFLHYNWHWRWHWGNGELGNNGVHTIDVCRWGLGVDYPTKVTSAGGRYRFDDDQETPDTHVVSFDFPDKKTITWEGTSCAKLPHLAGKTPLCLFQGDNGTLVLRDDGYEVYDLAGKELKSAQGKRVDEPHVENLLAAVRGEAKLASEIEEGHKSTLLCHLGNIAHRTGRTLHTDPKTGRVVNDPEANKLWSREYAPGWEPRV